MGESDPLTAVARAACDLVRARAYSIAVQGDGKIVFAGEDVGDHGPLADDNLDFGVARLLPTAASTVPSWMEQSRPSTSTAVSAPTTTQDTPSVCLPTVAR